MFRKAPAPPIVPTTSPEAFSSSSSSSTHPASSLLPLAPRIEYDVWSPADRKGFSKKNPPQPSFRVVVCSEAESVPSIARISSLKQKSGSVDLKFAVVGPGGLLDFFSFGLPGEALPRGDDDTPWIAVS